jgi:hypothetical protein
MEEDSGDVDEESFCKCYFICRTEDCKQEYDLRSCSRSMSNTRMLNSWYNVKCLLWTRSEVLKSLGDFGVIRYTLALSPGFGTCLKCFRGLEDDWHVNLFLQSLITDLIFPNSYLESWAMSEVLKSPYRVKWLIRYTLPLLLDLGDDWMLTCPYNSWWWKDQLVLGSSLANNTTKHTWMRPIVLSIHSFINIPSSPYRPSCMVLKILLEAPFRQSFLGNNVDP